jgi:hypothetical protein
MTRLRKMMLESSSVVTFLKIPYKAEGANVPGAGIWPEAVPRRNERHKKAGLLNWEGRCGIGRAV